MCYHVNISKNWPHFSHSQCWIDAPFCWMLLNVIPSSSPSHVPNFKVHFILDGAVFTIVCPFNRFYSSFDRHLIKDSFHILLPLFFWPLYSNSWYFVILGHFEFQMKCNQFVLTVVTVKSVWLCSLFRNPKIIRQLYSLFSISFAFNMDSIMKFARMHINNNQLEMLFVFWFSVFVVVRTAKSFPCQKYEIAPSFRLIMKFSKQSTFVAAVCCLVFSLSSWFVDY